MRRERAEKKKREFHGRFVKKNKNKSEVAEGFLELGF